MLITGCSIPVVQALWERLDWVRFPAARRDGASKLLCLHWEEKGFSLFAKQIEKHLAM